MAKLPAILLYDGDWVTDNVAGCSLAAQGLWLRMMFIGHRSERYGYLQQNGAPIPPESIARRCGCTPEQYATLLAELDAASVPSRTPNGVIFSRRMVKDAEKPPETAGRVARYRKTKKNSNASCNDVYNADVPIENANANETTDPPEVVSPEKPKPKTGEVVLYDVRLEAFDPEEAFEALCRVFPKPMRGWDSKTAFVDAVEMLCKEGKRRSEAAE